MTDTIPERKYRMIRMRSGDYLLPGNDGATLWRICRYWEDGSAERWDGKPLVGWFWQAAKHPRPFESVFASATEDDLLGWDEWECWEMLLPTRQAAIDAAMRASR